MEEGSVMREAVKVVVAGEVHLVETKQVAKVSCLFVEKWRLG